MVRDDYFADNSPSGQTPATLIEAMPYGAHATSLATGQNIAWGTRSAATPAAHRRSDGCTPRHTAKSSSRRTSAKSASASSAAVPSVVENGGRGATYAVEFGARG